MRIGPHDVPPGSLRVFASGIEITNRCRWFDPATGEAEVMLRAPGGVGVLYDERSREVLTETIRPARALPVTDEARRALERARA